MCTICIFVILFIKTASFYRLNKRLVVAEQNILLQNQITFKCATTKTYVGLFLLFTFVKTYIDYM